MKTTIKSIKVMTQKADGSPLINKNGDKYKSILITINDPAYADKTLSQYLGTYKGKQSTSLAEGWVEGEEVSITIEQNGDWLNFKPATKSDEKIDTIKDRVKALEDWQVKIEELIKAKQEVGRESQGSERYKR